MPIRVMSWNISRFNETTFHRTFPFNVRYILGAINTQRLDIVVLIEVQSRQGSIGTLIDGPGAIGVRMLLALLQVDGAADWQLVPPPRLNNNTLGATYTEGMAVFYRSTTVTFTGPYFYQGPGQVATGVGPGVPYGDTWVGALPPGNNRAPRITWTSNGQPVNFPAVGDRPPMLTTFTENSNGRNIWFMSVHLPPDQTKAAAALSMVDIGELLGDKVTVGDAVITIGDINYDPSKSSDITTTNRYLRFKQDYHFQGFTVANGVTRVEDTAQASPELTTNGLHRYQQIKSNDQLMTAHLDNAYVRYRGNPPVGTPYNPTVVDMVAGTDPYPTTMAMTIANILLQPNPDDLFRQPQNYGHVARWDGVSDHLPIVIDVP